MDTTPAPHRKPGRFSRRWLLAFPVAAIALAGTIAAVTHHAHHGPPAVCAIAVQAADYAMGRNGTRSPADDLRVASALRHAHWPTAAMRSDADGLAGAFAAYSGQGVAGYELADKQISRGIGRLLGACRRPG